MPQQSERDDLLGCSSVPAAVLDKCYIPFRPDTVPALHNAPITAFNQDEVVSIGGPEICLVRKVVELACAQLERAFVGHCSPLEVNGTIPDALCATAVCTPYLDGIEVTDAAVRYLGHRLRADVVVFDPMDLAKGPDGPFGEEMSNAFWALYDLQDDMVQDPEHECERLEEELRELRNSLAQKEQAVALPLHEVERVVKEVPVDSMSECASPAASLSPSRFGLRQSDRDSDSDHVSESSQSAAEEDPLHRMMAQLESTEARLRSASRLRTAFAAVKAFAYMERERSLAPEHRRFIYLRDFPAFNHVFLPWVRAFSAIASSDTQLIILAGVSPVQHAKEDKALENHRSFVEDLREGLPLERLFPAQFCPPTSGRFESLADVFTSAFVHRYQGDGLRVETGERTRSPQRDTSRSRYNRHSRPSYGRQRDREALYLHDRYHSRHGTPSPPHPARRSPHPPEITSGGILFSRIIRVCLVARLPERIRGLAQRQRQQRFLDANLHRLAATLGSPGSFQHLARNDSNVQAGQSSDHAMFLVELGSKILSQTHCARLVRDLPSAPSLSDLVYAYAADKEWDARANAELRGKTTIETADPIVAQVLAGDLSEKERELTECIVDPTAMTTTFDDIQIPQGIIDTLRTAVSLPLFYPAACSTGILSTESSAGVLLYGPPGTGKTMACRAVAKECGVRMLQIQSSTIQRCWVGETEQLINSIFRLARRLGPCVVFIDEIDAIFGSRDSGKKPSWYISALTEFMQEMDGLRSADLNRDKGIIVIGATNRPQDLDNAILRRLPRRVLVDLPALQERKKILEHYLAAESKSDDLDLQKLAMQSRLFSGSDLRHLVLAAAQNALKESVIVTWKRGDDDPKSAVQSVKPRPICMEDFKQARKEISPSCAANHKLLEEMRRWGKGERIQKDEC